MSWWRIASNQSPGLQTKYADIVLAIPADELVGAKLQLSYRCPSWCGEGHADSLLPVDVYQAGTELGVIGAHGKQRLNRVVCKGSKLGVDAITGKL